MTNKQSKTDIYFADFETLTKESEQFKRQGHTGVFLTCLSHINSDDFLIGKDLQEFFNQLWADGKNKIVYFHNLSWDGHFITKWLWRTYGEYYQDEYNKSKSKNTFWSCFRDGNKMYYISFTRRYKLDGKKKDVTIVFQCTYLLFQNGVASLAKSLGMEKHDIKDYEKLKQLGYDIDVNNLDTFYHLGDDKIWRNKHKALRDVFVKYVKNDVNVVKQFYKYFKKEFIENNPDAYNQRFQKNSVQLQNILTLTQLDLRLVKNNILNNQRKFFRNLYKGLTLTNENDYDFAKKFYNGGLTQFNPRYINRDINSQIVYIDINSSYPYSMTQKLPYGGLKEGRQEGDNYINYVMVRAYVRPKKGYENAYFIKSTNKGYRYTNEALTTFFYTELEYECLKQFYDFEEYNVEWYHANAYPFLKPYIEKYYEMRKQAKIKKDKAIDQLCKIQLNSLYGAFCKKLKYESMFFVPVEVWDQLWNQRLSEDEVIINTGEKRYLLDCMMATLTPDNKFRAVKATELDKEIKKFPNILIGATITSYSRVKLLNAIYSIGIKNFLYCDTDSIFFKWDKSEEELGKIIELDPNKLGAWKIETYGKKMYIKGAKRYALETDKGVKGALSGAKKAYFNSYDKYKDIFEDDFIPNAKVKRVEDDYGVYLTIEDIIIKTGRL